ncbi:MAG: ABC transporter substrate-binding protein [Lachnospiraceae bacterium]|nr:ABC transporter substrate-binding protein [Lachnospiraceae bacterium]
MNKISHKINRIKKGFLSLILASFVLMLTSCAHAGKNPEATESEDELKLSYATEFSVKYHEGGYKHIHIEDGSDYVLIPEGKEDSDLGIDGAVLIHEPVDNIYLAASSAMDLFLNLDSLDSIGTCSTKAEDYSIEEAKAKIESGEISYVGKYSSPDYEVILSSGCNLAIESTMITHSPKIKEELERLGIPVLTERSSYEKNPLGRLEWIKLYGVILGKESEAEEFFATQEKKALEVKDRLAIENKAPEDRKSVAYFYVSSNGYVNVRKPGDYVSAMIEMAGGRYAYDGIADESDNALSTMNINWEQFYKDTVDADILIYNATIDGGIKNMDELIAKNDLFADFKAVKEGNVYCSNADMFQKTGLVADIITDMYNVINDKDTEDLKFMYKVSYE